MLCWRRTFSDAKGSLFQLDTQTSFFAPNSGPDVPTVQYIGLADALSESVVPTNISISTGILHSTKKDFVLEKPFQSNKLAILSNTGNIR